MNIVAGLFCGLLVGQFLIQVALSLAISLTYASGLSFSHVKKSNNVIGATVAFVQSIVFAALTFGLWWLISGHVSFWNGETIASTLGLLFSILFSLAQCRNKLLFARMCAYSPDFFEDSCSLPRGPSRIALARERNKALRGKREP
ncbi:hypothetical protein HL666_09085 [Bradyrhizobium sp. 83002]|uniref:hypothetical protein n=1 Tax=Bradyrhizobium aeschynomenes TaxID=2734909 RepID=UPI0015572E15|nr:hypothetical protein [Bradyrhizobium aeschynomenes]NPU10914.1 hypothetical protein [Bradyrhizobium aeschynomenes]